MIKVRPKKQAFNAELITDTTVKNWNHWPGDAYPLNILKKYMGCWVVSGGFTKRTFYTEEQFREAFEVVSESKEG